MGSDKKIHNEEKTESPQPRLQRKLKSGVEQCSPVPYVPKTSEGVNALERPNAGRERDLPALKTSKKEPQNSLENVRLREHKPSEGVNAIEMSNPRCGRRAEQDLNQNKPSEGVNATRPKTRYGVRVVQPLSQHNEPQHSLGSVMLHEKPSEDTNALKRPKTRFGRRLEQVSSKNEEPPKLNRNQLTQPTFSNMSQKHSGVFSGGKLEYKAEETEGRRHFGNYKTRRLAKEQNIL